MDHHRVRPHARRIPAARRQGGRPLGAPPHAIDGTDPVLVRLTARGPRGIHGGPDWRPGPAGLRGGAYPTGRPLDPRRDFAEGAERNRALGIFGATGGISASVGVIASGLLTDGAGWRWVFLINVPVGVVLIAMAAVSLAVDNRDRRRSERFDAAGAVTVTGGLLLLVYALSRGADFGWGSGSTLELFAASVVLLSAFVRIEARSRSPLVPGSAVRNRTLVAAN